MLYMSVAFKIWLAMVSEHVPNWAATPWQKPAETAKAAGLPRRFVFDRGSSNQRKS
jgi:hypothetical protein